MGDSKTIVVQTELGEVLVHKMALGDYAQLLRAIDKLPTLLGDIIKRDKKDLTTELILKELPGIAADALPELAGVIAASTDKDGEFIAKLDLPDVMDVLDAALELNDLSRVVNAIKKIQARFRKPADQTPDAPSA